MSCIDKTLLENLKEMKEFAKTRLKLSREALYDVTRGGGLTIIGFKKGKKNLVTINSANGNIFDHPNLDLDRKNPLRSQCYYYQVNKSFIPNNSFEDIPDYASNLEKFRYIYVLVGQRKNFGKKVLAKIH